MSLVKSDVITSAGRSLRELRQQVRQQVRQDRWETEAWTAHYLRLAARAGIDYRKPVAPALPARNQPMGETDERDDRAAGMGGSARRVA